MDQFIEIEMNVDDWAIKPLKGIIVGTWQILIYSVIMSSYFHCQESWPKIFPRWYFQPEKQILKLKIVCQNWKIIHFETICFSYKLFNSRFSNLGIENSDCSIVIQRIFCSVTYSTKFENSKVFFFFIPSS